MTMQSARVAVQSFTLHGRGGPYRVALCLSSGPVIARDWLSGSEQDLAAGYGPARQQGFLAGRKAAKVAVAELLPGQSDPTSLTILPGVLEQPVLAGDGGGLDISISHADGTGFSAAFPRQCPMGVDIERWAGADVPALRTQMTDREMAAFAPGGREEQALSLTRLWCLKEALSKVLRTGMTFPFANLEISELAIEGRIARARFAAFGQYRGLAVHGGDTVTTLVLPRLLDGEPDLTAWSAWL